MIYTLIDSLQNVVPARLLSILQVFFQVEFRAFLAVLLSFFLVLAFGRRVIRWLLKQKVGDLPEFYNADLNKLKPGAGNKKTASDLEEELDEVLPSEAPTLAAKPAIFTPLYLEEKFQKSYKFVNVSDTVEQETRRSGWSWLAAD